MAKDIWCAKSLGVDGIVTGPLRSETTIHREHLAQLTRSPGR
jgi:copper homeostasis protein CutC